VVEKNRVRALIVYGTTEGQTRKVAERIAARIRELGHEPHLYDSTTLLDAPSISTFAGIIVAASVHQRVHQEPVTAFATAHRDELNAKPTAFVSVSLSAALEPDHAEAQEYVDRFVAETGWRPKRTITLAGALRNSEYDYFKQQIVKYIVLKDRNRIDTGRDYEFTDWRALSDFVGSYVAMVNADRG
jgi:menaquinone-dependent protoporphyrinogen oxidase